MSTMDHLSNLGIVFDWLAKYHFMLYPKKCVFVVTSGEILDFFVSGRDIEIYPKKVKSIMDMPPLNSL
jgi:hypothetical protein